MGDETFINAVKCNVTFMFKKEFSCDLWIYQKNFNATLNYFFWNRMKNEKVLQLEANEGYCIHQTNDDLDFFIEKHNLPIFTLSKVHKNFIVLPCATVVTGEGKFRRPENKIDWRMWLECMK